MRVQATKEPPSASPAPTPAVDDFDALYRSSRDDLYSYLTYLTGDRAMAEEVTAKAFEIAFRKRSRFRPLSGDLRGWLFGIARNAAIDELRRGSREAALELADEEADPLASASRGEDRIVLTSALRRLQVRDRELIALKFFAGLDNDQIARVLGISRSNTGTQLHRAVARLREQFGAEHA